MQLQSVWAITKATTYSCDCNGNIKVSQNSVSFHAVWCWSVGLMAAKVTLWPKMSPHFPDNFQLLSGTPRSRTVHKRLNCVSPSKLPSLLWWEPSRLPHSLYPAVKQIRYAPGHRLRVAEKERTTNTDTAFRLYELHPSLLYAACFRYTWLVVSCGTETVWVMGGVIDDGIAHNHPLLYTLLPISICLVLCLTASGRIGWTQHFYQWPPRCLSLGRTAEIGSVTSGLIVTSLPQIWRFVKYCGSLRCQLRSHLQPFFLEDSYIK